MTHFYFWKWIAAQIIAKLDKVYGNSVPAVQAINFLNNKFKCVRTLIQYKTHSKGIFKVITPEWSRKSVVTLWKITE